METIFKWLLFFVAIICFSIIVVVKFNLDFTIGYSKDANIINDILVNLSYSFIAAYLFYLLSVFFPNYVNKRRYTPFIKNKLNLVYENIDACVVSFLSYLPENDGINKTYTIDTINFKELKLLIDNNSFYNPSSYNKTLMLNFTNAGFIISIKQKVFSALSEILEYKDYLPSDAIKDIELIRNSDLWHLLNVSGLNVAATSNPTESINLLDFPKLKEPFTKELYSIILSLRNLDKKLN